MSNGSPTPKKPLSKSALIQTIADALGDRATRKQVEDVLDLLARRPIAKGVGDGLDEGALRERFLRRGTPVGHLANLCPGQLGRLGCLVNRAPGRLQAA